MSKTKHDGMHRIANERGIAVWGCIECARLNNQPPGSPLPTARRGDATRGCVGCFVPILVALGTGLVAVLL